MSELKVEAALKNLDIVQKFVKDHMDNEKCSSDIVSQLEVTIEEIFSNVANYAYNPKTGDVVVKFDVLEDGEELMLQFSDEGKPFNPLEKNDVDVSVAVEERRIGGLGIFMVKKMMDSVDYCYDNGKNILTLRKKIK